MTRTFEIKEAIREAVPLLIGLVGPSGSGKTGSALELAHGIQQVVGGEIGYIDTESKRALHYANAISFSDPNKKFKFKHLSFSSPFNPDSYRSAIEAMIKSGVKTVVVDSFSHEHEGPGGVLEMHESKLDQLAGSDYGKRERMTFLAWAAPKAERRALINFLLQQPINFIFCFRAKEKLKIQKIDGKNVPVQQGWQPIAGEEYVFEMTLNCLLLPGANGVPTWNPEEKGEKQMIKLPQQFKHVCEPGRALSIALGRELAAWAKGDLASAHGAATLDTDEKVTLGLPATSGKSQETPGQRLVKCMALLDSATSTADLKAKGATFKDETPENRNQLAAHYEARFKELREAGK